MAKVLLGVTGSVAAIRTPELARAFRAEGHEVRVTVSEPALYFFEPADLGDIPVFRDADEWPGARYERGQPVLHIELRKWADIYVVAPLDAHSLGRFALGLSDNLVSSVFRAWDFARPVVLAPAMNTLMWESPVTRRHLAQILEDRGDGGQPAGWTLDEAPEIFALHAPRIVLVPPQSKRLACGDVGPGAMAEVVRIAEMVRNISTPISWGTPLGDSDGT
jgi:phosphopantothenoylcysteine decarboxylase